MPLPSEPLPLRRSSVRIVPVALPRGCTACGPSCSPHRAEFEIRYRRPGLRIALPVCDVTLLSEVARLLASPDVVADDDDPAGVAIDAPVRMLRVVEATVGA